MSELDTTLTATKALALDQQGFVPEQSLASALIVETSSKVGMVYGDEPAVRCPIVGGDWNTKVTAEGDNIDPGNGRFSEVVVKTVKVANLARFSYELLQNSPAASMVESSMRRAIIAKANDHYLNSDGADGQPKGLLSLTTETAQLGTNLDTVQDSITAIEADGGQATHIIAAPDWWNAVSKLKTSVDSNMPLLAATTAPGDRALFGAKVITAAEMPEGTALVLDKNSVVSAYGEYLLARSEHAAFAMDGIAVRCTFRFGWAVVHPKRLAKLTLA